MDSSLGLVSEEDTEVPDHGGFFLVNLLSRETKETSPAQMRKSSSSFRGESLRVAQKGVSWWAGIGNYFGNTDDFTVGSLQSSVEFQEVPELGLGDNLVLGIDSHGVEVLLGVFGLVGESSSHNQEFSDLISNKPVFESQSGCASDERTPVKKRVGRIVTGMSIEGSLV